MVFNYTTSSGTKVKLTVESLNNVTAVANGKTIQCDTGGFVYNYNVNPPRAAIKTDLIMNGQNVNIELSDEAEKYIRRLKKEREIAALPPKEQLAAKIKKLENEAEFLIFVDADLCTGIKYYKLAERHDKSIWSKIAKHFVRIDTTYRSDEFDAMYGSNYKGWATCDKTAVNELLKKLLQVDNTIEIETLKAELAEIELKEKSDAEYQRSLFDKSVEALIQKYPSFGDGIYKIAEKTPANLLSIENNNVRIEEIVALLLEEESKEKYYRGAICDPSELPKVKSSIYADGPQCWGRANEKRVKIVPTNNCIIVAREPEGKTVWNTIGYDSIINGYFAKFGACTIRVFKYRENILGLLSDLGITSEKYYEDSDWFFIGTSDYKSDLYNIVTVSEDYNYLDNADAVLRVYTREKRWESESSNYPQLEEIKRVGKFLKLD